MGFFCFKHSCEKHFSKDKVVTKGALSFEKCLKNSILIIFSGVLFVAFVDYIYLVMQGKD